MERGSWTIDPDTHALLEMIRARRSARRLKRWTPGEARQAYSASRKVLQPPPEDVADVADSSVAGPLGPIDIRLYRPTGTAGSDVLPALVYFHGGGWLLGDLDSHDGVCRRFRECRARCRVVSVDYRMAPEHVFPAAVNDCFAATKYVIDNASSLGVDPGKVAVGGDSAGGNLAAVMALMARDGALPPLAFQLLIYPATDMMMTTISATTIGPGVPLTSATMKWFIDQYAKDHETDWHASPLRVASVVGTAPALVALTCGASIRYATKASITRSAWSGKEFASCICITRTRSTASCPGMGRMIRAADQAIDMIVARVLKQALWPPPPVI